MKHADWQLVWAVLLVLFLAGLGAGFQLGRHPSVDPEIIPQPNLEERPTRPKKGQPQRQPITHLTPLPVY